MGLPAADVLAWGGLIGLEIPQHYLEGVAMQLAALQTQALLVMDLDLEEATEPAPVFVP